MARRIGIATAKAVATGTAAKTLLQIIAPANQSVVVREIGISFHGVNNTHEPITVELVRQTTAGTVTSVTPVKGDDGSSDSLLTTAGKNATAEPTTTDTLAVWAVHPQTGLVVPFPDAEIVAKGGGRIGLRVTAANDVNSDCYIRFEE